MAEAREISVKLTADVNDYVAAMNRAAKATRRLTKAYLALPRRARVVARLAVTHSIREMRVCSPMSSTPVRQSSA